MIPEFERDNEWQMRLATKFLDPFYRARGWKVERYPGTHFMQRLHIDVSLRDRKQTLHVDEKIIRGRRDGKPAEKVNLETWSCSVAGREKPGWIARNESNESTHLLICFTDVPLLSADAWASVQSLDCVWIPFPALRCWFWRQGEYRWPLQNNKQRNRSLSRKVPISEIAAAISGVKRFTVPLDACGYCRLKALEVCSICGAVGRRQSEPRSKDLTFPQEKSSVTQGVDRHASQRNAHSYCPHRRAPRPPRPPLGARPAREGEVARAAG